MRISAVVEGRLAQNRTLQEAARLLAWLRAAFETSRLRLSQRLARGGLAAIE